MDQIFLFFIFCQRKFLVFHLNFLFLFPLVLTCVWSTTGVSYRLNACYNSWCQMGKSWFILQGSWVVGSTVFGFWRLDLVGRVPWWFDGGPLVGHRASSHGIKKSLTSAHSADHQAGTFQCRRTVSHRTYVWILIQYRPWDRPFPHCVQHMMNNWIEGGTHGVGRPWQSTCIGCINEKRILFRLSWLEFSIGESCNLREQVNQIFVLTFRSHTLTGPPSPTFISIFGIIS